MGHINHILADPQADDEVYGAGELGEDVEEEADGVADKTGESSAVAAEGTGEIGGEGEMAEDGSADLEKSDDELEGDVERYL